MRFRLMQYSLPKEPIAHSPRECDVGGMSDSRMADEYGPCQQNPPTVSRGMESPNHGLREKYDMKYMNTSPKPYRHNRIGHFLGQHDIKFRTVAVAFSLVFAFVLLWGIPRRVTSLLPDNGCSMHDDNLLGQPERCLLFSSLLGNEEVSHYTTTDSFPLSHSRLVRLFGGVAALNTSSTNYTADTNDSTSSTSQNSNSTSQSSTLASDGGETAPTDNSTTYVADDAVLSARRAAPEPLAKTAAFAAGAALAFFTGSPASVSTLQLLAMLDASPCRGATSSTTAASSSSSAAAGGSLMSSFFGSVWPSSSGQSSSSSSSQAALEKRLNSGLVHYKYVSDRSFTRRVLTPFQIANFEEMNFLFTSYAIFGGVFAIYTIVYILVRTLVGPTLASSFLLFPRPVVFVAVFLLPGITAEGFRLLIGLDNSADRVRAEVTSRSGGIVLSKLAPIPVTTAERVAGASGVFYCLLLILIHHIVAVCYRPPRKKTNPSGNSQSPTASPLSDSTRAALLNCEKGGAIAPPVVAADCCEKDTEYKKGVSAADITKGIECENKPLPRQYDPLTFTPSQAFLAFEDQHGTGRTLENYRQKSSKVPSEGGQGKMTNTGEAVEQRQQQLGGARTSPKFVAVVRTPSGRLVPPRTSFSLTGPQPPETVSDRDDTYRPIEKGEKGKAARKGKMKKTMTNSSAAFHLPNNDRNSSDGGVDQQRRRYGYMRPQEWAMRYFGLHYFEQAAAVSANEEDEKEHQSSFFSSSDRKGPLYSSQFAPPTSVGLSSPFSLALDVHVSKRGGGGRGSKGGGHQWARARRKVAAKTALLYNNNKQGNSLSGPTTLKQMEIERKSRQDDALKSMRLERELAKLRGEMVEDDGVAGAEGGAAEGEDRSVHSDRQHFAEEERGGEGEFFSGVALAMAEDGNSLDEFELNQKQYTSPRLGLGAGRSGGNSSSSSSRSFDNLFRRVGYWLSVASGRTIGKLPAIVAHTTKGPVEVLPSQSVIDRAYLVRPEDHSGYGTLYALFTAKQRRRTVSFLPDVLLLPAGRWMERLNQSFFCVVADLYRPRAAVFMVSWSLTRSLLFAVITMVTPEDSSNCDMVYFGAAFVAFFYAVIVLLTFTFRVPVLNFLQLAEGCLLGLYALASPLGWAGVGGKEEATCTNATTALSTSTTLASTTTAATATTGITTSTRPVSSSCGSVSTNNRYFTASEVIFYALLSVVLLSSVCRLLSSYFETRLLIRIVQMRTSFEWDRFNPPSDYNDTDSGGAYSSYYSPQKRAVVTSSRIGDTTKDRQILVRAHHTNALNAAAGRAFTFETLFANPKMVLSQQQQEHVQPSGTAVVPATAAILSSSEKYQVARTVSRLDQHDPFDNEGSDGGDGCESREDFTFGGQDPRRVLAQEEKAKRKQFLTRQRRRRLYFAEESEDDEASEDEENRHVVENEEKGQTSDRKMHPTEEDFLEEQEDDARLLRARASTKQGPFALPTEAKAVKQPHEQKSNTREGDHDDEVRPFRGGDTSTDDATCISGRQKEREAALLSPQMEEEEDKKEAIANKRSQGKERSGGHANTPKQVNAAEGDGEKHLNSAASQPSFQTIKKVDCQKRIGFDSRQFMCRVIKSPTTAVADREHFVVDLRTVNDNMWF